MPKKIEPAVLSMFFNVPYPDPTLAPAEEGGRVDYLDLSQCASIVNRRFYRQGLNWAVAGMKIHSASDALGTVSMYKIQSTWCCMQAWGKGFRLWNQMNDQVLDDQPSIRPRFHDFKIHMDSQHVGNAFTNNLIPYVEQIDNNGNISLQSYQEGEWTRSLIEMPNIVTDPGDPSATPPRFPVVETVGYSLKMHGDDTSSSKALIQGYADSRKVPTQPDPVTQANADIGWMNNLLDMGEVNEDIAYNLQTIGEDLPYSQFEYPGAGANADEPSLHSISKITNTTIGGNTGVVGGVFPAGLIKIHNNVVGEGVSPSSSFTLELLLVPGTHRGYMAESILEA